MIEDGESEPDCVMAIFTLESPNACEDGSSRTVGEAGTGKPSPVILDGKGGSPAFLLNMEPAENRPFAFGAEATLRMNR